ncbi:MAG: hypothetical protein ABIM32_01630 [candidate division WOR-3 bacterium]
MLDFLLLLSIFSYQRVIPEEMKFEEALRHKSYPLSNVVFSIPSVYDIGQISKYYVIFDSSLLNLNFEYFRDSLWTLDCYPRFFYGKKKYGVVIEPQFRVGAVRGWPNIKWQNLVCGAYSRAYLYYDFPGFLVMAGRNRISLNLEGLMAEEDPPVDLILFVHRGKHFDFSFFTGQLDSKIPKDSSKFFETGKLYNRYISGHSLQYKLKNFSCSFSEIAIFYSRTNTPDFYFLNPFMLYHPRVLDAVEGGEHNVFWIISANYWGAKYSTHLEFLVDDFYLPDPDQWAPHKLAWIFKFYSLDLPFRNSISGFCYSGATRWTYTHGLSLLYYENRSEVMGALNENDFDKIEIFSRKHFGDRFDLRGALWFKRKGEGSVNEKDIYWESGIDYPREYFLTGVVEKRFGQGLEVEWRDKRFLIRVSAEHDLIWNKGHEPEKKGSEWRIKVLGSFRVL